MSAIRRYIEDQQHLACRLAGVTAAIAYLTNDGGCEEGQAALIYLAEDLAIQLHTALDIVNLPKDGALA